MTTAVFARAAKLSDQIVEESRQLEPSKVLLTLFMVLPFVVGCLVGVTWRVCWRLLAIVWQAGYVGFRTAQGGRGKAG